MVVVDVSYKRVRDVDEVRGAASRKLAVWTLWIWVQKTTGTLHKASA